MVGPVPAWPLASDRGIEQILDLGRPSTMNMSARAPGRAVRALRAAPEGVYSAHVFHRLWSIGLCLSHFREPPWTGHTSIRWRRISLGWAHGVALSQVWLSASSVFWDLPPTRPGPSARSDAVPASAASTD